MFWPLITLFSMTEGAGVAGDGGGAARDWKEGLPGDLRASPALADFKDVGGLAKSFIDTQALLGQRPGMADLDAPSDATARAIIYSKLGRPDGPDGYKLAEGEGGKEFRILAHKHSLTAEQAEGIFKEMGEMGKAGKDAQESKWAEERKTIETKSDDALKTKWGDDYDTNKAIVRAAIEANIPAEELAELTALGLIHSPWLIDMMHKFGLASKEDTMHGGDGSGAGGDDLKTIQSKRMAMDADEKNREIRNDFMHPQHKEKVAEYNALFDAEAKLATKDGTFQPWE